MALDSLVTLPRPTIEAVIPLTVPVNVGDADRTTLPVPVEVVTPVPPLATAKVPDTTIAPVPPPVNPPSVVFHEVTPVLFIVYVPLDTEVLIPVPPFIVNVPPPDTEPDPEPAAKVIVVDIPVVEAEVTRP